MNRKLTANAISNTLVQALNDRPSLDRISITPVKQRDDGIRYVSRKAAYVYESTRADAVEIRVENPVTKESLPDCTKVRAAGDFGCGVGLSAAHGQEMEFHASGRHNRLKRDYGTLPLGKYRIDDQPPQIRCEVLASDAPEVWADCESRWTRFPRMRLGASDSDSALAEFSATDTKGEKLFTYRAPLSPEVRVEREIKLSGEGMQEVVVCARDNVGNATGGEKCTVKRMARLDFTEPSIMRFDVYGSDWISPSRPVIPVFDGKVAPVATLVVKDQLSGTSACEGESITGERACSIKLELPKNEIGVWGRKDGAREISDLAGNKVTFSYSAVRLPKLNTKGPRRDWNAWKTSLDKAEADALSARDAALAIEPLLSAETFVNPISQSLAASRLNFVAGRIDPDELRTSAVSDACTEIPDKVNRTERSMLGHLRAVSRCMQQVSPDKLVDLAPVLNRVLFDLRFVP